MNEYVVLKLTCGDVMLATLLNETTDGVVLLDPIKITSVPVVVDGEPSEQIITNPYCVFTRERSFTFNHKNVLYCKPLNPTIIKYYHKLVLAFGEERVQMEEFYSEEKDVVEKQVLKATKFH